MTPALPSCPPGPNQGSHQRPHRPRGLGRSLDSPPPARGPVSKGRGRDGAPGGRGPGRVTYEDSTKLSSSRVSIAAAAAASTPRRRAGSSASYPARGADATSVLPRRAPTGIGEAVPPRPRAGHGRATRGPGLCPPGLRASVSSRRRGLAASPISGRRAASRHHGHRSLFRCLATPASQSQTRVARCATPGAGQTGGGSEGKGWEVAVGGAKEARKLGFREHQGLGDVLSPCSAIKPHLAPVLWKESKPSASVSPFASDKT